MARNALLSVTAFRVLTILLLLLRPTAAGHDYHDALRKSILFFEGQRSGKLPSDQRLRWRRDSALHDGATAGVSTHTLSQHSTGIHNVGLILTCIALFSVFFLSGGLNRRVLRRRRQHKVRVSDGVHDDDAVVERDRFREEHGAGAGERVKGGEVGDGLPSEGDGEGRVRRGVRSGR